MKRSLPLFLFGIIGLFCVCAIDLSAQTITRVDGLAITSPICLNQNYELQVNHSFTCSSTLSYVWEKNSGEGVVTFTSVPGFPNRIYAQFSTAADITIRCKLICNGGPIVVLYAGGFTTGIAAPTISPASVIRCGAGIVNLTATPGAGNSIRWYNSTGTVVATGNAYSPSVSSSTTFYAAAYKTTGCTKESGRVPVTVTINPIPSNPTPTAATRCDAGTVTLTATPGSNGTTCNWYTSIESAGQILLQNPNSTSFTTPSLTTSTMYYVTSTNPLTGCESDYVKVTATVVNTTPPTSPVHPQRCGSGSVTYGATPASGAVIKWYPTATSTFVLWTGSTFPASASTTTTVYAANYYSASGCISSRIAVTATINAIPAPPADVDYEGSPCSAGTIVTVTPGADANTCRWYNAGTGGTSFATGTTYTLSSPATYYVSSYNSITSCESTSRAAVGCSGGRMATMHSASTYEDPQTMEHVCSVYPNPSVSGEFKIELTHENSSKDAMLQILDSEGRERVRHNFSEKEKSFQSTLPSGLYLVRLSGKSFNHVKKLVIL